MEDQLFKVQTQILIMVLLIKLVCFIKIFVTLQNLIKIYLLINNNRLIIIDFLSYYIR